MAYDNGIITQPVGVTDIRNAICVGSGDLVTLCSSNSINPMAKYKPVRYNKRGALTALERAGVRYGLSTPSTFSTSTQNPNVTWTYNRVRPYVDWSRYTDWDGYFHFACCPFAFDVSGAIGDGLGFQIFVDSTAATNYNGGSWDDSRNLKLNDLLVNTPQANGYLGFVIHDMTANNVAAIVVSNKRMNTLSSTVPTVVIYPETMVISGVTYPAVPFLQQSSGRAGHTFRFIACVFNNYPDDTTTTAYHLYTTPMDVYSLAIIEGVDRKDMVLNIHNTIMGLSCQLVQAGVTMTQVGEVTRGSDVYVDYALTGTIQGNFTTPSTWPNDGVRVQVTIRTDYGYVEDGVIDAWVDLPMWSTTYTGKTIKSLTTAIHAYIIKRQSVSLRSVEISAFAYNIYNEKVYFINTYKVHP